MIKLLKYSAFGLVIFVGAIFALIQHYDVKINFPIGQVFGKTTDQATTNNRLNVPEEFTLTLFNSQVPHARFMVATQTDDILVAQPNIGQISILQRSPTNVTQQHQPPKPSRVSVLIDGLDRPHSMAFFKEWLYVGEATAVGRIKYNHKKGRVEGSYSHIITGLDDSGFHWTKTIGFGPDEMLYLSSGSSCNVCVEENSLRAAITLYTPEGKRQRQYATGLRNTVGFDWAPWNGQLYGTDNGRDLLGDDYPPCELNRIVDGGFYGWPFFHGSNKPDPDYGERYSKQDYPNPITPAWDFRAHNAPLGIRFLNPTYLPNKYRHTALVALHGSWNRSIKDGYKVVALHWNGDPAQDQISESDFLWGFEKNDDVVGRPVDIVQDSKGRIFVSDDYSGAIYQIVAK